MTKDTGRRDHLTDFLRTQLGDLGKKLPVDGKGRILIDGASDMLMRHGVKLMEQFIGGKDPKTPKERKKRRIVEVATELFIRQGYRKTSVDEIAAEAGVAKGTVYLYFKTKADLLMQAVALEKYRYVGDMLEILGAKIDSKEKLRIYIKGVLLLVNEMPLVSRLMTGDRELLGAMEAAGFTGPKGAMDMQAGFIAFLIRRAVRSSNVSRDEIDHRATVLTGLMYSAGFIEDDTIRNGLSMEQFAETLANMLVDGIDGPEHDAIVIGSQDDSGGAP
jgi:AcrR family transcriptional regulator